MSPEDEAETIRRRMAELRRELACDMRDVGRSARAMKSAVTDPKFYVKKFPWATLAIAAGIGFMLIPKKKKEVAYPDPETLAELIRKNQVKVEASASVKDTKGVVGTLVGLALTWALKTGLNYVGTQLATMATKKPSESQQESQTTSEETSTIKR